MAEDHQWVSSPSSGDTSAGYNSRQRRHYNDAATIGQLSSPPQRSKELSVETDWDGIATIVFVALLVFVGGILSIHFQCQRLRRTLRKRKEILDGKCWTSSNNNENPTDDIANDIDIQVALESRKIAHQSSYDTLKEELKSMRQIQQSVREQVRGLEQFVAARSVAGADVHGIASHSTSNNDPVASAVRRRRTPCQGELD